MADMDKEIALAVNFNKAPQALKDAATAHAALDKALKKEKKQLASTQAAIQGLELQKQTSMGTIAQLMRDWDPDAAVTP